MVRIIIKVLFNILITLLLVNIVFGAATNTGGGGGEYSGEGSSGNGGTSTTPQQTIQQQIDTQLQNPDTSSTTPWTGTTTSPTDVTFNDQPITIAAGTVEISGGKITATEITYNGKTFYDVHSFEIDPDGTFHTESVARITETGKILIIENLAGSVGDKEGFHYKLTSATEANSISFEGMEINLNTNDFIELRQLPNTGLFNITLTSTNGNITDPFKRTECVTLSRTSRYIHLGVEKFSVYIPAHGSDFSLCLRTKEAQDFSRSCDSCGYLDFIDKKAELKGIFYYETHNQLIPYPPYFPDKAIESDKTSNIFTGNGENGFFENLNLIKSDTTGKISSLYSANFRVFEQDDLVCAELNPYQMDHITTKYLTSYLSEPITIHANMLTQRSPQNTLRMFETDSEIGF